MTDNIYTLTSLHEKFHSVHMKQSTVFNYSSFLDVRLRDVFTGTFCVESSDLIQGLDVKITNYA